MSDSQTLDRTFHFVISRIVETGKAPLEMENGKFLTVEPAEVVGHLNHPWPTSTEARPFT